MDTIRTTEGIDQDRRRLLATASMSIAAAGAASLLPSQLVAAPASDAIRPFSINVPEEALVDLRRRINATKWPERETVADATQGVQLATTQALARYWATDYDWRKVEARLNALPQFITEIDGLDIHFIHVRSKHENALPMIVTHGWPGSIIEQLKIIDPLTNPTAHGGSASDAFHLVIPSLPGHGFSGKPTAPGWTPVTIARAWATLMQRLGYERWVAQGGDWGSGVTHALARLRPPGLIAAHVNWPFVFPSKLPENPTPVEKRAFERAAWFQGEQSGYFREQATRPQTIGYALADSPAGQALWIYEKLQAWTDNRGNPEDAIAIDAMLDDISLYWFTNTAASSARIYWENTQSARASFSAGRIELPMAASIFPREIFCPPKEWAEALWPNLFYWNELDRGGHFAAFEQPKLFVEEMRNAFKSRRRG